MDKKRIRGVVALFLVLAIGNFLRMDGHEQVRPIHIFSLLIIGIFTGVLVSDLAHLYRTRKEDENKMV